VLLIITNHVLFIITSHGLFFDSSHVFFIITGHVLFFPALLHLEDLQKDALQFIFSHGKSCLESISFFGLSSGYVKLIIESDHLVCPEEIIYQKMIQWAQQRVH
jgi:hypothetical protein